MALLSLTDTILSYGGQIVLQGATLEVQEGERVALVGPNGAGKSTLLKIAIGELEPDSGYCALRKDARVGYLAQSTTIEANCTVWTEARSVFAHIDALEAKLQRLAEQMAQSPDLSASDPLVAVYERTQHAFLQAGGYGIDSQVRRVLSGLLFDESLQQRLVHELSGGQKTRLQLAKLLLQEPDLLVLDEPTNYLDMETVQWLEEFLEDFHGALLIVSHDRYFLDRVTHCTYELARGKTVRYPGNYSAYALLAAERENQLAEAYERQQSEIARMEDFIARNIVRASTTKRAQSRRKALERLERVEKPSLQRSACLQFSMSEASGKTPLIFKRVSVGFDGRTLFSPLTLRVERGEHVALLGRNGIGKTTLLRAIVGLGNCEGTIQLGHQTRTAYYSQEQEHLNRELTVLEELWQAYPAKTETEIRTRLGQLLFSGEDVYKRVKSLSGGERSRLVLAKLSFADANFLILDEPTNHLDLPSKEVLEEALLEYEGTILFVSHDRYFINRIATRVLELAPHCFRDVQGDYDEFVAKTKEVGQEAKQDAPLRAMSASEEDRQQRKQARMLDKQRRNQLQQVEEQIQTLEACKHEVECLLSNQDTYDAPGRTADLGREHGRLEVELAALYDKWAELAEQG